MALMNGNAARAFAAIALLGAPACSSPNGSSVPVGTISEARPLTRDVRGVVKLFADPYGDPVPTGITTGPDGALWFTDSGNALIGRITKRGKYTLQVQVGAEVSDGIVAGPDKNLWFTTNESSPRIGRITTAGKLTLFSDAGGAYPHAMTVGPDGALWIAESNGTVGRMTTQGAVTHFTVAAANAQLQGIVSGPDGNLWVTQYVVGGSRFSNKVIRVATNGKHSAFTVGYGPKFICVGPDKALWFAESSANAIGRITTSGTFADFPTGYKYAVPSGIATGPDGALWFTDYSGRAGLGRMTTKGRFTFYKVPGSFPELDEITPGPDARMWFTADLGPSGIGRITTR
ncbi:MAG: Virginiamycin B lyase [Candidatus Eremiobacteraeota bacterium]|nr:Virginiamycin B lyase [Candidatus Eremiobacteraeota bacterium]